MKLRTIVLSVLLLNLLAACGGGDNDSNPPAASDERRVPASALSSASAYSQWAGTLANSETEDAVAVEAGMKAPMSETEDPIVLR